MTILSKGAPFFICHSDTLTIPTRENRKICTGTRENRKNQKDKLFRKNIKSRFMDYLYSIEQYTAKKNKTFQQQKTTFSFFTPQQGYQQHRLFWKKKNAFRQSVRRFLELI